MTTAPGRARRREIAESLRTHRRSIATAVTDDFLRKHPDWSERYGSAARVRGEEDAAFHVDFLAGAVLSGSPASFETYARWTAGVLAARGIEPRFLVENLEQVGRAARGALAEDDAGRLVDEVIAAGVDAVRSFDAGEPTGREPDGPWGAERELYLQAIRAGERTAALNIVMETVRRGASVTDVYRDILQPAQYEIGRLWEANEITVATEHMATAVTQYVMAQLYPHLEVPEAFHGTAVVTGVNGELHQVGANMVADVLTAHGWDVKFLGTELPHSGVIEAVEEHDARVVGISVTVLSNLPAVCDLVDELRAAFGERIAILVGGSAFRADPEIWHETGADAFGRDLHEAVEAASRFVPEGA